MVLAARLLLMLEAVTTDLVFTISLKRSTQNIQLSTSCRPITPSIGGITDIVRDWREMDRSRMTQSGHGNGRGSTRAGTVITYKLLPRASGSRNVRVDDATFGARIA